MAIPARPTDPGRQKETSQVRIAFCVHGVISPLLANLYLHLLDRIWERHGLEQKYAARLVRYADDMVLLCAKGSAKSLSMLRYILDRLDLTLNETKTKIINAWEESFGFLGFEVRMNLGRSGKAYPHIQPGKRAVKRINAKLIDLTRRRLTPIPLPIIVQRLNQSLRGWACYFDYGAPQQNPWVDSGSGRAPSTGYKAVSAPRQVRNPKDFPGVGFALALKPQRLRRRTDLLRETG